MTGRVFDSGRPVAAMRRNVVPLGIGMAIAGLVVMLSLKALLLLCLPLLVVMLRSPVFALLVTAASTATGFLFYLNDPSAALTISIPKICGVITLFSFFVYTVRSRQRLYLGSRLLIPFIFVLASGLSLLFSPASHLSEKTFVQLCGSFSFYFLAVSIVKNQRVLRQLLVTLTIAFTLLGLYSFVQYFLPSTWTNEYDIQSAGLYQAFVDRGIKRASGFSHPGVFSFILVLLLPYIVYLYATARSARTKLLLCVCIVVCVNATLMSHTRMAFMALVVMFGLFCARRVITLHAPLLAGIPILATVYLVFFMPSTFSSRVLSFSKYMNEGSVKIRLENQRTALRLFAENPIFGVGLGNFEEANPAKRPVNKEATNMFLEVAAETGVVGILALLAMTCMLLKDSLLAEKNSAGIGATNLGTIVLISVAVSFFMSLFASNQDFREWWLFVSIPAILRNIHNAKSPRED